MTKLGQYLIKKGKVTEEQLEQAFRAQLVFGGRIGTTLVELGFITERDLGETLEEVLGVPYASFEYLQDIPGSVIGLVPPNLAASYKVVPFRLRKKTLHLAMMAPNDLLVQDEVSFLTELKVMPWVAPEIRILEALDRYYKVPRERRYIVLSGELNHLRQQAEKSSKKEWKGPDRRKRSEAKPGNRNEVGLDGLPIEDRSDLPAAAVAEPAPAPEPGRADVPRSLEDWRIGKPQAEAAPAGGAAATAAVATAAEEEPESAGEPEIAGATDSPAAAGAETAPESPKSPTQPLEPLPEPASLEDAADMLARAQTREEVARVLLAFSGKFLRRTGLFILQKNQVLSWHWSVGNGSNDTESTRGITLPLDAPSLFTPFRSLKSYYLGPVAPLPANRDLFQRLNAPLPKVAVVVPIPIQGKVAVLLYGDNGQEGMERIDLDALQRLARKASAALEALILKNKIRIL